MKVRGILGQLFDLRRRSFVAIRTRARIFPHVRHSIGPISLARIALACATACSSKSDPPPPPPPVPVVVTPDAAPDAAVDLTKPCLPPSLATANVAYVRADGPRVTACYGNGDDSPGSLTACLVLDEVGTVLGPRAFADVEAARLAERDLRQPRVTIEEDPDATSMAKAYVATYDQTRAFGFEDGHAVFFDLRTNKRIGSRALSTLAPDDPRAFEPPHAASARWVGNKHVLIAECGNDSTYIDAPRSASGCRAWLLATNGDAIPLTPDFEGTYEVVDDELVAVWKGKQVRWIAVPAMREVGLLSVPGTESPVGDLRITRFSDQLVVAFARPAGVAFVDRAMHLVINKEDLPICP
jgi:hypothetical protein